MQILSVVGVISNLLDIIQQTLLHYIFVVYVATHMCFTVCTFTWRRNIDGWVLSKRWMVYLQVVSCLLFCSHYFRISAYKVYSRGTFSVKNCEKPSWTSVFCVVGEGYRQISASVKTTNIYETCQQEMVCVELPLFGRSMLQTMHRSHEEREMLVSMQM